MKKKDLKEISTSLTTLIFVVIALTGVMMFFHLFNGYTKKLHELIGLGFVVVAVLHVVSNWTLMKKYFTKKIFIVSFLVVAVFSGVVSYTSHDSSKTNQKMAMKQIVQSTFTSPIEKTLAFYGIKIENAKKELQANNIKIENFTTINQVAKTNGVSPYTIFDIIKKSSKNS